MNNEFQNEEARKKEISATEMNIKDLIPIILKKGQINIKNHPRKI